MPTFTQELTKALKSSKLKRKDCMQNARDVLASDGAYIGNTKIISYTLQDLVLQKMQQNTLTPRRKMAKEAVQFMATIAASEGIELQYKRLGDACPNDTEQAISEELLRAGMTVDHAINQFTDLKQLERAAVYNVLGLQSELRVALERVVRDKELEAWGAKVQKTVAKAPAVRQAEAVNASSPLVIDLKLLIELRVTDNSGNLRVKRDNKQKYRNLLHGVFCGKVDATDSEVLHAIAVLTVQMSKAPWRR